MSNRFSDNHIGSEFSASLRATFFATAARVLLRPLPLTELDRTSAGRAGTYFTIARLLPLFEQYAIEYVPALKAELALLSPYTPETFRNGEEEMLKTGLSAANPERDSLADILHQLTAISTTADRDVLYVKAIRSGAMNGDSRIREFAEKIDNPSLKESARSFAALVLARHAIEKNDPEKALKVVNDKNLSSLHRAWVLAEVSRLLKKSEPERALNALNEAAVAANSIGIGEQDRVYALVCVSLPLIELDRTRSWSVMSDIVKAANAVPGYIGERGKLYALLRTRNVVATINAEEPSFDMLRVFDSFAKDDLQLAISLADNLTGEGPRSSASLAIARSVLNRSKSQVASVKR